MYLRAAVERYVEQNADHIDGWAAIMLSKQFM